MLIPIIFLLLATAFVFTLLRGILQMMGQDFKDADALSSILWKLFKLPILLFIMFIIFVLIILPKLDTF